MKIETKYNIGDVVYAYSCSNKEVTSSRVKEIKIAGCRIMYLLEDCSYRNECELSPTREAAKERYCETQIWKALGRLGAELRWMQDEDMDIRKAVEMISDYIWQFANKEIPF